MQQWLYTAGMDPTLCDTGNCPQGDGPSGYGMCSLGLGMEGPSGSCALRQQSGDESFWQGLWQLSRARVSAVYSAPRHK